MTVIIKGIEHATIKEYAALCDTTRQAIEHRIKEKEIDYTVKKGIKGMLINIVKYPPVQNRRPDKKPKQTLAANLLK